MLQNPFYTAECLNHVRPVIVQVPQFTVMTLVSPPEWILLQHLDDRIKKKKNYILVSTGLNIPRKWYVAIQWPLFSTCDFFRSHS